MLRCLRTAFGASRLASVLVSRVSGCAAALFPVRHLHRCITVHTDILAARLLARALTRLTSPLTPAHTARCVTQLTLRVRGPRGFFTVLINFNLYRYIVSGCMPSRALSETETAASRRPMTPTPSPSPPPSPSPTPPAVAAIPVAHAAAAGAAAGAAAVVARAEAAAATAVCAAAWTPPERETASPAHRTQPQPLLTPRALEATLRTAKAAYEKTEKSICETDMRNL